MSPENLLFRTKHTRTNKKFKPFYCRNRKKMDFLFTGTEIKAEFWPKINPKEQKGHRLKVLGRKMRFWTDRFRKEENPSIFFGFFPLSEVWGSLLRVKMGSFLAFWLCQQPFAWAAKYFSPGSLKRVPPRTPEVFANGQVLLLEKGTLVAIGPFSGWHRQYPTAAFLDEKKTHVFVWV